MKTQIAALSILALFANACDAPLPGDELAPEAGVDSTAADLDIIINPGTLDMCKTAEPDQIAYVLNGTTRAYASEGAAYAYGRACPRWIVDYKIATYSPEWEMYGHAWDLPSSAGLNGTLPNNSYDCSRFTLWLTFYRKKSNETSFTSLGGMKQSGQWNSGNGKCELKTDYGTLNVLNVYPSQSGWDTYRVAVSAKLRNSFQEVRAVGRVYIEPPK